MTSTSGTKSHGKATSCCVEFHGSLRTIAHSPPSGSRLDAHFLQVEDAWEAGRALGIAAGIGLAMVVTHDCQLDKEWNQRVRELEKGGMPNERMPNSKPLPMRHSTERSWSVRSSIPADLRGGRGNVMAGKVIGYLPVPKHPDELVDECVVDLTYQCTVDRLDVVKVTSVSEVARKQLRYALIQLDALRTTDLGFEVEAVVGRTIQKVEVPDRDPLTVRIQLDDGQGHPAPPATRFPDQETGRGVAVLSSGG